MRTIITLSNNETYNLITVKDIKIVTNNGNIISFKEVNGDLVLTNN